MVKRVIDQLAITIVLIMNAYSILEARGRHSLSNATHFKHQQHNKSIEAFKLSIIPLNLAHQRILQHYKPMNL